MKTSYPPEAGAFNKESETTAILDAIKAADGVFAIQAYPWFVAKGQADLLEQSLDAARKHQNKRKHVHAEYYKKSSTLALIQKVCKFVFLKAHKVLQIIHLIFSTSKN